MDADQLVGKREGGAPPTDAEAPFRERFTELFEAHFPHLFRYLNRLSGDADLASDLAQEAFVRLYRRGSMPDAPSAWLVTASMNLFRNSRTTRSRRKRLLTSARGELAHSDPAPYADRAAGAEDARRRVRAAVDRMPERDRQLLLLRAEGYGYREIAAALDLNETSVGTLLARARKAFRQSYEDSSNAP
jgi:RNA polymerase sigma-70 factor (ECF subfamily)